MDRRDEMTMSEAGTGDRPESEPILTPLGPGGRPFARWRAPLALLSVAVLVAVVTLMLSARAPGVVGEVTERLSDRIRAEAPDAGTRARQTLDRTGIEEKDTLAHIGLWGAATILVGLTMWSWRSLVVAVVVLAVGSTALELVQEMVTPSRISEWRDVGANLVGIGVGVAVVVALNSVSGLPARIRRLTRGRGQTP